MNSYDTKTSHEYTQTANLQSKQESAKPKQTEEKPREIKGYLDNIIESSLDGIVVSDNMGYVTKVNKSFLKLIDFEEEEILGKHIMELSITEEGTYESTTGELVEISKEFFYNAMEMTEKLFEEGKISNWESYYLHKDGKIVPVEMNVTYLYDEKGDITGSVGINRDITERRRSGKKLKQAYAELEKRVEERTANLEASNEKLVQEITEHKRTEENLRKTRDYLDNIIESSLDAIVVGDDLGHITRTNSSFLKLVGYEEEEIIGKHTMELSTYGNGTYEPRTYESTTGGLVRIDREFYNESEKTISKLFNEGKISNWETYYLRKDKRVVLVEMNIAYLYSKEGDIIGSVGIIRDITERKEMEKNFRETKEFLEKVIENTADGIMICDLKGNIINANTAIEKMTGLKKEELIGQHTSILIAKDKEQRSKYLDRAAELFKTGYSSYESTLTRKDGKHVEVDYNCSMIKDEKGDYIAGVSILRDITERKRAEEKLRETKDHLDNIIESSLDAIIVTDNMGTITRVNKYCLELLDYTEEELVGKHTTECTPMNVGETYESTTGELVKIDQEFYDYGQAMIGSLIETEKVTNWETYYFRKDTRLVPVEQNIVWTNNAKGEKAEAVAIIRDITERKRAEKELRETKDQLDNIIESSLDPVIISDSSGNITRINNSLIQLIGYKQDEIIGKHTTELVPTENGIYESTSGELIKIDDDFHKESVEHVNILFEEGKVSNWETYYFHKNKKVVPVEMNIVVLHNKEGEGVGAVGIIRDITERKRAEKERERLLYDLKDKNKELEQVFYVASHDLRSPLVNIQGFSKELEHSLEHVQSALNSKDITSKVKESLAPDLEEDIPEALQYIHTSIAKMDSLLSGLLRLSRLGRAALNIKKLDMNNLISDIVKTFEYTAKEKGITPEIDELPPCLGDETQINQVFSNLLDNTLKYLDPKRPGTIKISGKQDNGQVIYHVEDNGIGIAEEHQDRIYEIFHRLNPEVSSGEGLGLTIARRILDRHAGKIWVESELGKGSKFFVSLPTN